MQMRMGAAHDLVFFHPLVRDGSQDSQRLERLCVVEDVVDHAPEVEGVVGEGHHVRGHGRRKLPKATNKIRMGSFNK